jgi:hypothetical protein
MLWKLCWSFFAFIGLDGEGGGQNKLCINFVWGFISKFWVGFALAAVSVFVLVVV